MKHQKGIVILAHIFTLNMCALQTTKAETDAQEENDTNYPYPVLTNILINDSHYTAGDPMTVEISLENTGEDAVAKIYVWIGYPDGRTRYLTQNGFSRLATPLYDQVNMPAGYEMQSRQVVSISTPQFQPSYNSWNVAVKSDTNSSLMMDDIVGEDSVDFIYYSQDQVRTFKFGMKSRLGDEEDFHVQIVDTLENEALIAGLEAQLSLPEDERYEHLSGTILAGDDGVNQPWSWYIDPFNWGLSPISPEVCDTAILPIDEDLDYWTNTIGMICPWGSYVKEELIVSDPLTETAM